MPDRLHRSNALDGLDLPARPMDKGAPVRLRHVPHTAKLSLRGDAAVLSKALGADLPTEPDTTTKAGSATALWLGPDEWLLVGKPGQEAGLAADIGAKIAPLAAALIDVSETRTVIRLSGPRARDVLSKGCPLDLPPGVFGRGRVAQSVVGKVSVVLHQTADDNLPDGPAFDLYVGTTFAEYLWLFLEEAAREWGFAIDA